MKLNKEIQKYIDMFESKEREDGTKYYFIDSDTKSEDKEQLLDSVRNAHGNMLPHDWIFETYLDCLHAMLDHYDKELSNEENIELLEDRRHEIVDGLVSIYTHELTAWLASSNYFAMYVDEVVQEYEAKENVLMAAQYKAIDEIYSEVFSFISD